MSNNIAPHAAKKPPKVTLVIGSGSVKCAAGLGVAQVLLDAGIQIERVVGCSAGALFGSLNFSIIIFSTIATSTSPTTATASKFGR